MTLGLGWAILDAHTGENRLHSHVAHQVSLALEVDCAIGGPHPLRLARGEAAIIPAGIQHCLTPAGAPVRTIYVDPLFDGLRDLIQTPVPKQLNPKEAAAGTIRADFAQSIDANAVHGSDSLENAAIETAYFFSATELCPR